MSAVLEKPNGAVDGALLSARDREVDEEPRAPDPKGEDRQVEFSLQDQHLVATIQGEEPPWVAPLGRRVAELLSLEQNWDSYGSRQIDPRVGVAVLNLLASVMNDGTPLPSLVPTSRGGVQLEWHSCGMELELELSPDGDGSYYFLDVSSGEEREGDLGGDFDWLWSRPFRVLRGEC